MITEKLFEVATEFRFDVGEALLNTRTLQGAVQDLSSSTEGAMKGLGYLAGGLVAHLGFGSGGLLTILSKAVSLSQEFSSGSLNFANTIGSNMSVLSGDIGTFNDKLATSHMLLEKVQDAAIASGLDAGMLSKTTNTLAPPLAQHGKLGTDFSGGIEMSKNILLAARFMQINPAMATESVFRALQDRMPLQAKLFARLASTEPFKQAHVYTQQQFMGLGYEKKIALLDKALKAVAGDSELLAKMLDQLDVQFTILRTNVERVLRPLGDSISKALADSMKYINGYLAEHGKSLGASFGKLFGKILEDPKGLLINLLQLSKVSADFQRSLSLVKVVGVFKLLTEAMKYFGYEIGGINWSLVGRALLWMAGGIGAVVGGIGAAVSVLATAAGFIGFYILPEFTALLFLFQTISRARAIAEIRDYTAMLSITPKLTALTARLKTAFENIISPMTKMMNFFAEYLAKVFEWSFWIQLALPLMNMWVSVIETVGNMIVVTMAHIEGALASIIGFILDIVSLKNPFSNVLENYLYGFKDYLSQNPLSRGDEKNAVSNHVYNIGSINARFDLKEQLEPDRVAFAVTSEIKRLATYPTQGSGQTLSGPFTRGMYFTGVEGK